MNHEPSYSNDHASPHGKREIDGPLVTCLLRIGANWLTTKKHGLALKLFVAYASLAIPNAVLRALFSIVDPV
ncbi:hypothetical protein [Polyangium sp. 15x6]|uniref:hypothetical protein n=1 Tax=Polyangium sp. 15x6 TaxID=3042687 RepID=UPI00249CF0AD|nr:hypothetical protein [Polyangium sp. 15x6]MDI3282943.1 hypothetical protein [Polyangium sp. 15x6]